MPKNRRESSDQQHEAMEVHGFDLLAQVEAMLRHAREYQREVQRLRGMLGTSETSTSDRTPIAAARDHVKQLREAWANFGDVLDDIEQRVGHVDQSTHQPTAEPRRR